MCIDQEHELESNFSDGSNPLSVNSPRVEVVDSWHKCWPTVLSEIERQGGRDNLCVDADGWLSARQSLLVAFKDNAIAGHLVFSIRPMASTTSDVVRVPIEAYQDDLIVRPGFSNDEVRKLLVESATQHAKSLRCRRLVNFG